MFAADVVNIIVLVDVVGNAVDDAPVVVNVDALVVNADVLVVRKVFKTRLNRRINQRIKMSLQNNISLDARKILLINDKGN